MKRNPPSPAGIDWAAAIDLLTKAELTMDRPNHDQLAEVFNLVKQKPSPRDAQKPRDKDKGAAGASGVRPDKGAKPGPAARTT